MMSHIFTLFFIASIGQEKTPQAKLGWILWFVLFVCIILAAFVVVLVINERDRKRVNWKKHTDYNIRVYTYDFAKRTFYSFDRLNISNTKSFTEEQFYAQFSSADKYLVEDWLRSIAHKEKHPDFLQADIHLTSKKKYASSMLEFTSVNYEKNLIHFNSHLLPNIYQQNAKAIAKQKDRLPKKYLLPEGDAEKFISRGGVDYLGSIYYFCLFSKDPVTTKDQEEEMKKLNRQIVLVLSRFLTKTRKMVLINDKEEVILDTSCISKIAAMTTASTIQTYIQQFFNANTSEDRYQVAIGISNGSYYQRNYNLGKEQAKKMAEAIQRGLSKEKVLFYDESFFINYQQQKAQKDEIRMVIRNATYRLYFTPTLNILTSEPSFYLLDAYPYGTQVKDAISVINIAKDIQGGNEKLFASFLDRLALLTRGIRKQITFAIRLPYGSLPTFIKVNESRKNPMVKFILVIDETDILTSMDDPSTTARYFHDYHKKGYLIGINIENPNSGLRTRILRTISYFFVPPSFTTKANENSSSTNDLRNIQASYGIYRVPLVYYGLKDFDDIELGAHYGGKIFQCEELALPSSRIEAIDQKKVMEVIDDTKNLVPKTPWEL